MPPISAPITCDCRPAEMITDNKGIYPIAFVVEIGAKG